MLINENLWEGQYTPMVNDKRVAWNIYAHSEEECKTKLKELIREMNKEKKAQMSKNNTQ